jgi:hypothetical protein
MVYRGVTASNRSAKYRIQPNFCQTNTVETINLSIWKLLNQAQKNLLNRVAIGFIDAERLRAEKIIKKQGIKDTVLKGAAAAKYLQRTEIAVQISRSA